MSILGRVADGGDLTAAELDAAIPDVRRLEGAEREAWRALSQWADEADVRAQDMHDAAAGRERMRSLAARLGEERGFTPEEIERGEDQAWHVPVSGCLAILALVAALAWFAI